MTASTAKALRIAAGIVAANIFGALVVVIFAGLLNATQNSHRLDFVRVVALEIDLELAGEHLAADVHELERFLAPVRHASIATRDDPFGGEMSDALRGALRRSCDATQTARDVMNVHG